MVPRRVAIVLATRRTELVFASVGRRGDDAASAGERVVQARGLGAVAHHVLDHGVGGAIDLWPGLYLRSAGRPDQRSGLIGHHAIRQHHLTDPDLVAKPRGDAHEKHRLRAKSCDGTGGCSCGASVACTTDAGQRDRVVAVRELAVHRPSEVDGPAVFLDSAGIVELQRPPRRLELDWDHRQDHNVDLAPFRPRTYHALHSIQWGAPKQVVRVAGYSQKTVRHARPT
jgi:hypothetical protein